MKFPTTPRAHKSLSSSPSLKNPTARKSKNPVTVGAVDYLPLSIPVSAPCHRLPWTSQATLRLSKSPILQLHQEIIDFIEFVTPNETRIEAEKEFIAVISGKIREIYPEITIIPYGSTQNRLNLPSSDLDLSILSPNSSISLEKINEIGSFIGLSSEFISKTEVPVVRIHRKIAPKLVEISKAAVTSSYISQEIQRKPELRPLILVLKAYLRQRDLNSSYTGGVGSYLLYHLVDFAVGTHPAYGEDVRNYEKYSLSHFLLHFLKLYGEDLDPSQFCVSFSPYRLLPRAQSKCPDSCVFQVLSPDQPHLNLARNLHRFHAFRTTLRTTYALICDKAYLGLNTTPMRCLVSPEEEI